MTIPKDTTWLIVGENPGASKLTKATKLNIATMNEPELEKILA